MDTGSHLDMYVRVCMGKYSKLDRSVTCFSPVLARGNRKHVKRANASVFNFSVRLSVPNGSDGCFRRFSLSEVNSESG